MSILYTLNAEPRWFDVYVYVDAIMLLNSGQCGKPVELDELQLLECGSTRQATKAVGSSYERSMSACQGLEI